MEIGRGGQHGDLPGGLSGKQGDLFVLFNENRRKTAEFRLEFERGGKAEEILFPDAPAWKQTAGLASAAAWTTARGGCFQLLFRR